MAPANLLSCILILPMVRPIVQGLTMSRLVLHQKHLEVLPCLELEREENFYSAQPLAVMVWVTFQAIMPLIEGSLTLFTIQSTITNQL